MKNQGFTLIEIMIVMVIISIVSSIAIPKYNNYIIKSKINSAFISIRAIIPAYEYWLEENYTDKQPQPTLQDLNVYQENEYGDIKIQENKISIELKSNNHEINNKYIRLEMKSNTWECDSNLANKYKPRKCKSK